MDTDRALCDELYELAAQSPAAQVRFLDAVAHHNARLLGEDFCGTGALSATWAGQSSEHGAVGVDRDQRPLGVLRERAAGCGDRVRTVCADAADCTEPADLIAVLNFSIGYFHERAALVAYLSSVRARLGGVFVCDTYGGADQFTLGESDMPLPGGATYIWEQRRADPLTARVVNAMHFVLEDGRRISDAFVYDWRLWSIPELRDAMTDAGFASVDVYDRLGDAVAEDGSVEVLPVGPGELDENYVVYVAGRV